MARNIDISTSGLGQCTSTAPILLQLINSHKTRIVQTLQGPECTLVRRLSFHLKTYVRSRVNVSFRPPVRTVGSVMLCRTNSSNSRFRLPRKARLRVRREETRPRNISHKFPLSPSPTYMDIPAVAFRPIQVPGKPAIHCFAFISIAKRSFAILVQ